MHYWSNYNHLIRELLPWATWLGWTLKWVNHYSNPLHTWIPFNSDCAICCFIIPNGSASPDNSENIQGNGKIKKRSQLEEELPCVNAGKLFRNIRGPCRTLRQVIIIWLWSHGPRLSRNWVETRGLWQSFSLTKQTMQFSLYSVFTCLWWQSEPHMSQSGSTHNACCTLSGGRSFVLLCYRHICIFHGYDLLHTSIYFTFYIFWQTPRSIISSVE